MGRIIRNGVEYGSGGTASNVVYLTQEAYDALPDDKLTDGVEYRITDANTDSTKARNIAYDNSESGIEATSVQGAIDSINGNLGNLLKYVDMRINMENLSWNAHNTGSYWCYLTLPNGITAQNYLFSVILGFGESGGYCRYVGYENGALCIIANNKPTAGAIQIRVFYNGLIA